MALNTDIFEGLINKGDKVLVGVSGGEDSMCLLSLLKKYQDKEDFELYAMHVNHNLRGKEAERDQAFVQDFCKREGINCVVEKVDVKPYAKSQKQTIEEAARELRYEAFYKVMRQKRLNKLALAHNKNDQAETVLMHILRGSSIRGGIGMSRQFKQIVRPLITVTRKEIEEYNKQNHIDHVLDSSNAETQYSRNYIRNEVFPKLNVVYPNAENAIMNFSYLCQSDNEFIESMLPLDLLKKTPNGIKISQKAAGLHRALSARLVYRAVNALSVYADIEQKHIASVLELFNKKSGSQISLPHNLVAHKDYDGVAIEKNVPQIIENDAKFAVGEYCFANFGTINIEKVKKTNDFMQNEDVHFLDCHTLPSSAVWRRRKDGDTFWPVNSKNKKLSDYFTDKKIERRLRDNIPVLAKDSTVYVVAGLGISDKVKITDYTKECYKIEYKR